MNAPSAFAEMLETVEPSRDGEMIYYPCAAQLRSGEALERVYVVARSRFLKCWGPAAESDPGKRFLDAADVVRLWPSSHRLPARFANQIYGWGESGMGYVAFCVRFRDGSQTKFITGNAVDFVHYPSGLGPNDVVEVSAQAPPFESVQRAAPYFWCVVDDAILARD